MRKTALLIISLVCACCLGCSNLGFMQYSNETQTQLSKKNFRVFMTNVHGESTGFCLLGCIPIVPPRFSEAMANLHEGAKIENKPMALANVAEDYSNLYLILFSIPKITITADVVEFLD
jgi:hypothetical protein